MRIQVQTDRNVDVSDGMIQRIESTIESALSRLGDHVTRVDVHVASETSGRPSGDDKRCVIEARMAGRQPVAVTHHAGSVGEACSGAVHKLESLIGNRYGRSDNRKGADSLSRLDVREELS